MLTADDMLVDDGYDTSILGVQERYHVSYVVEVSKMAVIRMSTLFSLPGTNHSSRQSSHRRVQPSPRSDYWIRSHGSSSRNEQVGG